jgi:hypothetical protein
MDGISSIVDAHDYVRNNINLTPTIVPIEVDVVFANINQVQQAQIQTALAQIAATPEGRAVIESAVAANGGEPIDVYAVNLGNIDGLSGAGSLNSTGLEVNGLSGLDIMIDFDGLSQIEVPSADGSSMRLSLERTLFHEFYHLASGHTNLATGSADFENDTVAATNEFMATYFGEVGRAGDYSTAGTSNADPIAVVNATLIADPTFGSIGTDEFEFVPVGAGASTSTQQEPEDVALLNTQVNFSGSNDDNSALGSLADIAGAMGQMSEDAFWAVMQDSEHSFF